MSIISQFGLLLWKNLLVQRRSPIFTLLEAVIPVAYMFLMVWFRTSVTDDLKPISRYDSYPVRGDILDFAYNITIQHDDKNDTVRRIYNPLTFSPTVVYFSPDTVFTQTIMDIVAAEFYNPFTHEKLNITGFPDEETMVENFTKKYELQTGCTNPMFAAIVFNFTDSNIQHFKYTIRLSSLLRNSDGTGSKQWNTKNLYPTKNKPGPRARGDPTGGYPGYWWEGFLTLQKSIDNSLTFLLNNMHVSKNFTLDHKLKRFPYPEFRQDSFAQAFGSQLPSALIIGFVVSVIYVARSIVEEKEKRLKEYMRVMGLSGWLHWVAHFLTNFAKTAIVAALITLIMCVPIGGKKILEYSDPSVIFVFLLVFAAGAVWFAFTVSVFFHTSNAASGVAFIAWFLSQTPFTFLNPRYDTLTWQTKMLSSLSMTVGMSYGSIIIGDFELSGSGVQWSTISQPSNPEDDLTLLHVILMILADIGICIVLTWYVEAVYPGEGVPQKPWFPFKLSYWCPSCGTKQSSDDYYFPPDVPTVSGHQKIERDPEGLKAEVNIQSLGKVFGSGSKRLVAVNKLNLKMFPGQVTALLGHNGAGKSTTMAMLTGILKPTSGHAFINGYDIRTSLPNVRKYLGLCPQYNVLFPNLTVKEHMKFFCKLKGRNFDHTEYRRLLDMLGLTQKKKELAKTLSGGMKRKLSVAIALVGGSEVVMLDEPTSGMDPNARHEAWKLLQAEKANRTILLTTHYMEEADLLGDRIAILAKGRLECCGSSLFLKKHYGAGYHITVVFVEESGHISNKEKADRVLYLLKKHCREVEPESNVGLEATFLIPQSYRGIFQKLFSDLENNQQRLAVSSFGVSVTTMEEVFLKVGEIAEEEETENDSLNGNIRDDNSSDSGVIMVRPSNSKDDIHLNNFNNQETKRRKAVYRDLRQEDRNTGITLWFQQLRAMITKRIVYAFRTWYMLLVITVIPLIFVALGLLAARTLPGATAQPPLSLTLKQYGDSIVSMLPYSNDIRTATFMNLYKKLFSNSSNDQITFENVPKLQNNSIDQFMLKKYNTSSERFVDRHYVVGVGADLTLFPKHTKIESFFNDESYHSVAVGLSLADNALLQMLTGRNLSIETVNHPLPPTGADSIESSSRAQFEPVMISMNLLFSIAFTVSSYVSFLVKERQTKIKHMQFLSGVMPTSYWIGHFLFDFITFLVPLLLLIALFAAYDTKALIGAGRWRLVLLLEVDYAWAIIPMMYAISFLFKGPTKAYVLTAILNVIGGFAVYLANLILSFLPDLGNIQKILEWVFMVLFPNFCLGQGVTDLMTNENYKIICDPVMSMCNFNASAANFSDMDSANCTDAQQAGLYYICCKDRPFVENSLSWEKPGIGRQLSFLAFHGILYWLIILIVEMDLLRPLRSLCHRSKMGKTKITPYNQQQQEEDADVMNEREKVHNMSPKDAPVLTRDLTKYYGFMKAVDKVCFSVHQQDCFGLLGVNGAGKTSTFQMLTGENLISDGEALIKERSVGKSWRKACHYVGYCPQFDAVLEELTGNELLYIFARLRGIPERNLRIATQASIKAVGIEKYQDRQIKTYSGGNKRRMSLGVALIGLPDVLLLDEPTTGVDPKARRSIWDILATVREHGTSLVLTSHSMEECEALCTRIAIMVAGRFRCLGSPQHLKSKFGAGYSLQLKIQDPNMIEETKDAICRTFPGSTLKELHYTLLIYELARRENITWSKLFQSLESLVRPLGIVDYSLSQTTLEQVFLQFSKGY